MEQKETVAGMKRSALTLLSPESDAGNVGSGASVACEGVPLGFFSGEGTGGNAGGAGLFVSFAGLDLLSEASPSNTAVSCRGRLK